MREGCRVSDHGVYEYYGLTDFAKILDQTPGVGSLFDCQYTGRKGLQPLSLSFSLGQRKKVLDANSEPRGCHGGGVCSHHNLTDFAGESGPQG